MGRRKSEDEDIINFILILIFIVPFLIIYGIVELIKNIKESNDKEKQIEEKLTLEQRVLKLNSELDSSINKITKILYNDINYISFNCDEYYDEKISVDTYEEYVPTEKPSLEKIKKSHKVLRENKILESVFKNRKIKRLKQEEDIKKVLNQNIKEWELIEENRFKKYSEARKEFLDGVTNHNNTIINRRKKYLELNEDEVNDVFKEFVIKNLEKIECNTTSIETKYIPKTKTGIIEYKFPDMSIIPIIKKYNYLKTKNEIKEIKYTEVERRKIYEKFIFEITLKITECALSFDITHIDNIIFNGLLYTLNPSKGINENFIILSVHIDNEKFNDINIKKVEPKACLKSFNFRYIEDLANIKNIKPYENVFSQKNNASTIDKIDYEIDGFEFEKFSRELLLANEFKNIEVTSSSGDYGADVIAYKNDIKYAIQCKKYSQPVGVKAIQEVMGSKSIYNCHVAVVLTNNMFTPQARKLAEQNNVLLWDREKLKELIRRYENKNE